MGMPSLSPPRAEAMREPCPAFEQHAHVVTCPSLLSWVPPLSSQAPRMWCGQALAPFLSIVGFFQWAVWRSLVAGRANTLYRPLSTALSCVRIVVCRAAACAARAPPSAITHAYSHTARVPGSRPRHPVRSAIADPRDGGRRFRHVFCHYICSSHGSSHGRKLVRGHIHNSFQCKNIGTQPLYFSFSKLASAERHPSWFFKLSTRARWALFPFMQPLVPQNAGMTVGWPLIKRNVTNPKPSSGARKRSSSSPSSHTA